MSKETENSKQSSVLHGHIGCGRCDEQVDELDRLRAVNAELLAALETIHADHCKLLCSKSGFHRVQCSIATKAIAKAEGR